MTIDATAEAGSVDSSFALSAIRPSDVVLSPDGLRVYTSSSDGLVRVYSSETGKLLSYWRVGHDLGALDVSPDGRFLMVVENQPLASSGTTTGDTKTKITVYKVDLATGEATGYPYWATGQDRTFFDVTVLSDNRVMLSQTFAGSGWIDLKLLDTVTGKYSLLDSATQDTIFSRSSDGTQVLVAEGNISDAPLHIREVGVGIVASHGNYDDNVNGFNRGVQAFDGATGLVAQHPSGYNVDPTGYALHIYDAGLNYQRNLALDYPDLVDGVSGLAFDDTGGFLFVLDNEADEIVQLSTADWSIVQEIPLGVDLATTDAAGISATLLVAPGMRFFTVITDTGLLRLDNPAVDDILEGTARSETIVGTHWSETLLGHDGNDRLYGRGGSDRMEGGKGHDLYVVDSSGDEIYEAGSSGSDTVQSAISFTLPVHFEKLILTGSLGIDGRGNAAANAITGNGGGNFLNGGRGNDLIDGGAGNDQIVGGLDSDTLKGGAGEDRFYFNSALGSANVNKILDFAPADDVFRLDRSVFTRIGSDGTLSASAFHAGTAAADAGDRIVYDQASGKIFYDPDGTGAAAAILFATVTPGTPLTYADFTIYA